MFTIYQEALKRAIEKGASEQEALEGAIYIASSDQQEQFEKKKEIIAERLAEERKRYGVTQEKLADVIHYSKPTVCSWERKNGKNKIPDFEQLIALSLLYKCDIDYLVCDIDTRRRESKSVQEITGFSQEALTVLYDNNLSLRLDNGITFTPKGNEFISYFIENSQAITKAIEEERNVRMVGKHWESLKGFNLVRECFNGALSRKPFSVALEIEDNSSHKETVIQDAIKAFYQYDLNGIAPELYLTDEEGTLNTIQLEKMFRYLYDREIKSEERKYLITKSISSIVDRYIEESVSK